MTQPNDQQPATEQPNSGANAVSESSGGDQANAAGGATDSGATAASSQPPAASNETQEAEQVQPEIEPGKPIGDAAPPLAELQNQLCDNCHSGVLYVTRYDTEALHEQGQGTALLAGHESGGAYDVECANCDFTESRAFNPGPLHGRSA